MIHKKNAKHEDKKWQGAERTQPQKERLWQNLLQDFSNNRDNWLLSYTPFFRFVESSSDKVTGGNVVYTIIERIFPFAEKNQEMEKLLQFWKLGFREPCVTLLLVFYQAAFAVSEVAEKFLREALTWRQLPKSDRLLLEFLFQDILGEFVSWQYLYNQNLGKRNPSLHFNLELFLPERKWQKNNFPLWPFSLQEPPLDFRLVKLFHFLHLLLQKKCNVLVYGELKKYFHNQDAQLQKQALIKGDYKLLQNLQFAPNWVEKVLYPYKYFSSGGLSDKDLAALQHEMRSLPFYKHHVLFLLYRVSPRSAFHPSLFLAHTFTETWLRTLQENPNNPEAPSHFIRFVEYLYAIQQGDIDLAQSMEPFLGEFRLGHAVLKARALSLGGYNSVALSVLEQALESSPTDMLILHEIILLYKKNHNEQQADKYKKMLKDISP